MKKLIILFLCVLLALSGCGHRQSKPDESASTPTAGSFDLKGVWLSYYEMEFGGLGEVEFRTAATEILENIKNSGFNTVFVHMRANSDAFYPSELFPWAKQMRASDGNAPNFDPLAIWVEEAHRLDLLLHAWINPYRVSAVTDNPADLADGCPAKIWLTDTDTANDDWAVIANGGIYYNPAIPQVQRLIVDGVREIAEYYKVDGIHFDDYFYPTTDPAFDADAYARYRAGTVKPLSLEDWRRANVNTLVSSVYAVAKSCGKVFGISPAADISANGSDRNYTEQYADIAYWMMSDGYIDYIAPQLYFGFDYPLPQFRYDALLKAWLDLPRRSDVKLYIGLAGYKIGTEDAGSDEWMRSPDILARQTDLAKTSGCDGVILFSYSSLTNGEDLFQTQMHHLQKTLQGGR